MYAWKVAGGGTASPMSFDEEASRARKAQWLAPGDQIQVHVSG